MSEAKQTEVQASDEALSDESMESVSGGMSIIGVIPTILIPIGPIGPPPIFPIEDMPILLAPENLGG